MTGQAARERRLFLKQKSRSQGRVRLFRSNGTEADCLPKKWLFRDDLLMCLHCKGK